MDGWLQQLHAARVVKLGVGDEDAVGSKHGGIDADFHSWSSQLWARVDRLRADATGQDQVCVCSVCV